ncbi:hypothetical protein CRE_00638 [Caenorhabditis remanei]|uniref:Uncharacterized protein n=1 Tax=Caenorhabditis remanei TaxID=31234 RepID=E3LDK5_CAERE|nr:hypothetical protein CRE_00638 [Caenorhabditis remanei]
MVIQAGPFINARVGELDIIRSGWRHLQRAMHDEDRVSFEQMINTPAFCVKKFEEMFLLKRINPYAQTEELRIMTFDHSECNCKKTRDGQDISVMKNQLSDFLKKWDNLYEKLKSVRLPSGTVLQMDDLHQTVSLLMYIMTHTHFKFQTTEELEKLVIEERPTEKIVDTKTVSNLPTVQTEDHEKHPKQTHHINAVAEQCLWNVAHISAKPTHPENTFKEDHVPSNKTEFEPVVVEKDPYVKQSEGKTEVEHFDTESTIKLEPGNISIVTKAVEEKTDISIASSDILSPAITDNGRSAGTPDSGMVSDISEIKLTDAEMGVIALPKQKDPAKLTGRDGRRYRQKLREAEQAAGALTTQEETPEEDAVGETTKRDSFVSESTGSEQATISGKEKRRLKDKLRKEKKEQERLLALNKAEESKAEPIPADGAIADVNSVDPNNAQNDSKLATKPAEAVEQKLVQEPPAVEESTADSSMEAAEILSNFANTVVDTSATEPKEIEGPIENKTEDETQVKNISKRQKRKAQKKAAKGEYVVNDNHSHSVELLPGEYKLMQVDHQRYIQELNFGGGTSREIDIDQKVEEKKRENESKGRKRKMQNLYVPNDISQNILDKGKWLAYVVDDKNPNGVPKCGEVSSEEMKETMKILNQKMTLTNVPVLPDGYIDDVNYLCPNNSKHFTTTINQLLPELNADIIRSNFYDEVDSSFIFGPAPESDQADPSIDDLQILLNSEGDNVVFQTERKIFIGLKKIKSFFFKSLAEPLQYSPKISSSESSVRNMQTRNTTQKRFKKFADRESRRKAKGWSRMNDCSPYALMIMLYINTPKSDVGFADIETVLFPSP